MASAVGVPFAGVAAFAEVAELAVPPTGTGGFGGGGVAGQPAAMARVIIAKIDNHRAAAVVTRCIANMSILLGTYSCRMNIRVETAQIPPIPLGSTPRFERGDLLTSAATGRQARVPSMWRSMKEPTAC